jgi:hypothetical protein
MVPFPPRAHIFADFVDFHDGFAVVIMASNNTSDFQGHQTFHERIFAPDLVWGVAAECKVQLAVR